MKSLNRRLINAFAILLAIAFICLGVILGQATPYMVSSIESLSPGKFYLFLSATLLVVYLISMLIAIRMLSHYAKPIDDVSRIAQKIATGELVDLAHYPQLYQYDDPLANAIKEIAGSMEKIATRRNIDKDRLKTLIDGMGSGLLMFGRGGTVRVVNGTFRKTFGYEEEEIIGQTITSIGLPEEIEQLIEDVFMLEKHLETQVQATVDDKMKAFNVSASPVIGNHGNWLGIVVVIHDVTKLVHLEEVRKDFVANVSHELRTPVTSIKGFAETLLQGAMNDEEVQKNFLEIIYKESERLQYIVEDLLILSGVERTAFQLDLGEVNLKEVMDEAIQLVGVQLQEKQMEVKFEPNGSDLIEGDYKRLLQVFVNLLSNAITYSPQDKHITIKIERVKSEMLVMIEDQGIGIESEELPRLFERFYRVDRARSRDSGGTGLGLAIVKHLVEAHQGRVDVYSKPDVGTAFYIYLPLKQETKGQ